MPDGLRAAASGLEAQQARLDALANDVANVSTPGYRSQRVVFADLVDGAGVKTLDLGRSAQPGAIAPSDNPLALAIDGPGFFQVKRADGTTVLTRSGDFALDASGAIVTAGGASLQPPLQLPKGTGLDDVKVAADGTVTVAGKTAGKVQVVTVAAPSGLRAVGDGLFAATAASGEPTALAGTKVVQRQLEASDVDLAGAMTGLIEAQRAYALASRAVQVQDQLREIANGIRR